MCGCADCFDSKTRFPGEELRGSKTLTIRPIPGDWRLLRPPLVEAGHPVPCRRLHSAGTGGMACAHGILWRDGPDLFHGTWTSVRAVVRAEFSGRFGHSILVPGDLRGRQKTRVSRLMPGAVTRPGLWRMWPFTRKRIYRFCCRERRKGSSLKGWLKDQIAFFSGFTRLRHIY